MRRKTPEVNYIMPETVSACTFFQTTWSGSVGSVVDCINKVNQHQAQLVLGLVTIPICNQPPRLTQPGHPSVGRRNEYQRKLGRKQAHRAMHWSRIRGFAV